MTVYAILVLGMALVACGFYWYSRNSGLDHSPTATEIANTRVIQRWHAAFNARDVGAMCRWYDADAFWILATTELEPSEAIFHGKERIRAQWQSALDASITEQITSENTTIKTAGDVIIVRGTRLLVEGVKSGRKARASVVHEFLLRNGRIIRQTTVYDTLTWASLFDDESDSLESSAPTARGAS